MGKLRDIAHAGIMTLSLATAFGLGVLTCVTVEAKLLLTAYFAGKFDKEHNSHTSEEEA